MPHIQRTHTGLSNHCEYLRQQLIEGFTLLKSGAEGSRLCSQAVIVERLHCLLKVVNAGDNFTQTFQLPIITGTEDFFHGRDQHGSLTGQSKGEMRGNSTSKRQSGWFNDGSCGHKRPDQRLVRV